MFNKFNSNESNRGQVGIGTLIIFIALVLVSAVAAGVLINTAGDLQSRASDTGSDAQAQVSNQIDVVSATGYDDGSDGIDEFHLVVKKSPGSDPIDLSKATIQYQSGSKVATLIDSDSAEADKEKFKIEPIGGSDDVLDSNDERARIVIAADQVETGGTSGNIAAGSSITLKIVDQSGASTVYGINVPDVLTGSYVEV